MKTARRIKDITQANINSILDKVEQPQKMIGLMIQEMEDAIVDLKHSVAARVEERTAAELEEKVLLKRLERWSERARMAVERDRDDLAKEALVEKNRVERSLELLRNDLSQYESLIADGRGSIVELEEKLELVQQRQRLLIQRGIHAVEKKRANDMLRNAESNEAYRRFLELEARIEKIEAEAEVAGFVPRNSNESENEFSRMESDAMVEQELAALKKQAKKSAEKAEKS